MAKTTLLIRLDKMRESDNKYPIYLTYFHKNSRFSRSTHVYTSSTDWDAKVQRIRGRSMDVTNTNDFLKQHFVDKLELIRRDLVAKGKEPYAQEVQRRWQGEPEKTKEMAKGFWSVWSDFLKVSSHLKTANTIKSYKTSESKLKAFEKKKKIMLSFEILDPSFRDSYTSFLTIEGLSNQSDEKKGLSRNSVGKEIKVLKTFLKFAESRGHVIKVDLKQFKVFQKPRVMVYLTQDEFEHFKNFKFPPNQSRLTKVRDIFVAQARCGLRVSDLFRLDANIHIKEGAIKMRAYKNQEDIYVPVFPEFADVMKKYDWQLPKISDQKYNDFLKEAGRIAGINSPVEITDYRGGERIYITKAKHELLTSQVAIKTFITHLLEKDIPAKSVALFTGKSINTIFQYYTGAEEQSAKEMALNAFK